MSIKAFCFAAIYIIIQSHVQFFKIQICFFNTDIWFSWTLLKINFRIVPLSPASSTASWRLTWTVRSSENRSTSTARLSTFKTSLTATTTTTTRSTTTKHRQQAKTAAATPSSAPKLLCQQPETHQQPPGMDQQLEILRWHPEVVRKQPEVILRRNRISSSWATQIWFRETARRRKRTWLPLPSFLRRFNKMQKQLWSRSPPERAGRKRSKVEKMELWLSLFSPHSSFVDGNKRENPKHNKRQYSFSVILTIVF